MQWRPSAFRLSRRYALSGILALFALAALFVPIAGATSSPQQAVYATSRVALPDLVNRLLDPPAWSANVRANTDNSGNGQHEPALAVNPLNPDVVVVANKDYRENNIKHVWVEASRDGGQTWPTQFRMTNGIATDNESDPVVQARDDGRIYVSCLTTGNNGVWITWTDDNGLTWHQDVPIIQNQGSLQDKDWFAIDNNPSSPYYHRMYMAWAPGGVVSSYSTDGGESWTAPQQIPNPAGGPIEYPYPVVAPNGDVFLFHLYNWGNRGTSPSIIKVVKSTDGGVSWSQPVDVATIYQPESPPRSPDQWRFFSIISASADPTDNNRLYAAWTDNRNINTNGLEVFYSASTDHGTTWGPISRLSHDPTGVIRDHITPVLKVGPDGRVNALWLDRRLDPGNRLFQAWYTSSTDGGTTWEPDTQVSDAPGLGFDLNVGLPPGSGNAAGDYWGLDAVGPYVYTAWTDTRNGEQDIYTSRGVRGAVSPTSTPSVTPTVLTSTPTNTPGGVSTGTPSATSTVVATATSTATPQPSPSVTATPCVPGFSDVSPSDYFYDGVRFLVCRGVVSGYADNTYRPYNDVTRAQICKMLVLGFGWTINTTGGPHFTDVPPAYWAYDYIETVYNQYTHIIGGYDDGTFRPGNNMTRGQLSKVVVLSARWPLDTTGGPHFTDVPTSSPFYAYVETAYHRGVISGYADRTFRPNNSITRGQTAKVLFNTLSSSAGMP